MATHGRPRILVVIPSYNRSEELGQLLQSLRMLEQQSLELAIVIVDDCSDVPVAQEFEGALKTLPLTIIRNSTNQGPARARNRGAHTQTSDYLWFLDSDTEIFNPRTLSAMVSIMESGQSHVGAVGGVVEERDGERLTLELTIQPNCTFLYRKWESAGSRLARVDGLSSANLFLSRALFERAGGFCESLRRDEDNDLCMTLAELGYCCVQASDTVVLNKITDAGRDSGAFAHFADPRHYVRDLLDTRLALLARHFPGRLAFLWLLDLIVIPVTMIQKKRGRFVTNRFNKAISKITLPFLCYCAIKQISCYARGLAHLLGLARLSFAK